MVCEVKMYRKRIDSSSISEIGYERGRLEVKFKKTGEVYQYQIPEELSNRLLAAESKGKFFNQNIRPNFKGKKIDG